VGHNNDVTLSDEMMCRIVIVDSKLIVVVMVIVMVITDGSAMHARVSRIILSQAEIWPAEVRVCATEIGLIFTFVLWNSASNIGDKL